MKTKIRTLTKREMQFVSRGFNRLRSQLLSKGEAAIRKGKKI